MLGNFLLKHLRMTALPGRVMDQKKQTPKRPLSSIADDLTKSSIFCQNNFLEQIKIFQNVDKFIKKRFKERTLNLFLMDLVEVLKSI